MPDQQKNSSQEQHKELIEPIKVNFDEASVVSRYGKKDFVKFIYVLFAFALIFIFWFVVSAKSVIIEVSPAPETLQLSDGSLSIKLQDRFLAQPGEYDLTASKPGYYTLKENISIGRLASYTFKRTLKKKPGLVSISVDSPELAIVYIDNRYVGVAPMQDIALEAGTHTIELQRYRYQTHLSEFQVEGAEQKQHVTFSMVPDWSQVSIDTKPAAAQIWLDGENLGATPQQLEVDAGRHRLELVHPDFSAYISEFVVLADRPLDLGVIELDRDPSYLIAKSSPSGARVFMNEQMQGVTPITITVLPNVDYKIRFEKLGYRELARTVKVKSGESKAIEVGLQAILASVHLDVVPKTAVVLVDGKLQGYGDQTFSLTTAPHVIEVKESGYNTHVLNITPKANSPVNEKITLMLREGEKYYPERFVNSQGQQLQLITPGEFTMGSSRREQGRRANEVLRNVKLKRRFYIGVKEVSNQEFARFDTKHNSGNFNGVDLSLPKQPVVNISWEQAARYCNWLSELEDLPLSYRERDGRLIAENPLLTGYRLVTEAEWAWVARVQPNGALLRSPWGENYPPQAISGNYADQQARKIIGFTIPEYNDGFAGPAPTGSFAKNQNSLYDIEANAAEWMHDYYTIHAVSESQVFVDPVGPSQGKHHVVRGSSWLRGTLSNTRLAYRDYREKPHVEIGFRIARYIEK